jgi:hypothetical protein
MPQSQSDNQTDKKPNPDDKEQLAAMPSTTATATTINSNSKKRKQPGEKGTKAPANKPPKKGKVDGFLLAAKGWAAAASKDLAPYLERILKKEADQKARNERRERGEASPPPSSPSSSLDSPDVTLPTLKSKQKPKPPISNHHRLQQKEYQQQRKEAASAAAAQQPNNNNQQLNDVVQKAFETGHNGHLAASIGRQLDKMMLTNGTTTTTTRPSHAGPSSFTGRPPLPQLRLVPAPSATDHHNKSNNNTSKSHKSNSVFKIKVYAGPEGNGCSYYEPTQHAQQHEKEGKEKESLPPPPPQSVNNIINNNIKLSDVFDTPPGLSLLGPAPDHHYHPQPIDMTPFTEFLLAQNQHMSHHQQQDHHHQQQQQQQQQGNTNNDNAEEEDIDYEALQEFIGELEFSKDDPALILGDGGAAAVGGPDGDNIYNATTAHEQERQHNDRIMQSHAEAVVAELQFTLPIKPTTSPSVVSPGLAAMLSCLPPVNAGTINNGLSSSMQRRTTRSSGNGLFSPRLEEGCDIPSAAMFNSPGELPGLMSPSILAAHLPF